MTIKETWRDHPLCKAGKVELVPTSWVWQYWGRDVSEKADLLDGREVTLNELWENICEEGLHDPLIMRVGLKNKKFRLEAGNHRIQVLHDHGIDIIPLTVEMKDECGPHLEDVMTDATHNFDAGDEIIISKAVGTYMRPSEVFRSLQGKTINP